ncbi:MAG: RNA polymerase subunit sigma-54 [Erysipelotrichaceae bacterium]|nr:RNA polymerase subunit sigma-54 [Erysipelotrichaceae bacterium]
MKNALKLNQSLKQTFQYSKNTEAQMNLLAMDQKKISQVLKDIAATNPFLEFTPSVQMDQFLEQAIAAKPSLQDELFYQLHTGKQKYHKKIAEYIIESLDDRGFFTQDLMQVCQVLQVSMADLKKTLALIQSFEPTGVAATSHADCLYLQLMQKNHVEAANLIKNYAQEIEQGNIQTILEEMNLDQSQLEQLFLQIRQCNPYPCSEYSSAPISIVIPEFEIVKTDGELIIEPKEMGKLSLGDADIQEMSDEAKAYFNQAKFYVDSINKRNKTLMILANELIGIQKNYFLAQEDLQACTLEQIASRTGFAISTVSRVLSNKYYEFEGEVYPVKSLFVSKTKQGTSQDAIKNELRRQIESENKTKPYSDEKLVQLLSKNGLFVSRRTIAKYRDSMNIPAASKRKITKQR